jgi:RNA polymerase sigma factor (sigma-70 family)
VISRSLSFPTPQSSNASPAETSSDALITAWYAAHHRQLYALCLRILVDPRDAEDALQDAFVEAWRSAASYRGDSALGTWLHAIAARVATRRLRANKRYAVWMEPLGEDDVAVASPAPRNGERMDLEQAIRALPPRARAVLVLHEIHGYRLAEIGEWMGTSIGTVKSQLHRARQILKGSLDP